MPSKNGLDRLNTEIERCALVTTLFPTEASLLRPVSADLSEIIDDWKPQHRYSNMKARGPSQASKHFQKRGHLILISPQM